MESLLQTISPKETLSSQLLSANSQNLLTTAKIRSDNRSLYQSRPLKINERPISNRQHSIAVQKGNSAIITALSFEIAKVKSNEKPGYTGGYVIPNVELHSNANPLMKVGSKPLLSTQFLNTSLSHVLDNCADLLVLGFDYSLISVSISYN